MLRSAQPRPCTTQAISLTAAFGVASSQLDSLFKGPAQVWNFGGSIIGPIFTGGAISGQVAQATAGQKAALLFYELAIQSAFADVENSLVSRQQLSEQIVAQEALVQALREYSRFANLQYNGGYAPYTDVLQAEQQLFPAELNLATARAALLTSVVRIYQATGGGWVDIAQKAADSPAEAGVTLTNAPAKPDRRRQRPDRSRDGRRRVRGECLPRAGHWRGGGARAEKRLAAAGGCAAAWICVPGKLHRRVDQRQADLRYAQGRSGRPSSFASWEARASKRSASGSDYIEVILPASLLKNDSAPVEVHWTERA